MRSSTPFNSTWYANSENPDDFRTSGPGELALEILSNPVYPFDAVDFNRG